MSKRNRREHGRIISVEAKTRGDALAEDVAAGVTSIAVEDAGDFDEDGGWLLIGGQVVEFTECDDDTGVITLADPLTAAAEQGDPVRVWSELYEEVVDYQQALVELDGEYDNPDPVVAEVAEGVGSLPEGDRGRAGESCTLLRVGEDEWEVVAVGGRGRQSQGTRWEQDDSYVLTAADVDPALNPTYPYVTMSLSQRPNDEALTCVLAGVPQQPTEWSIDYDAQTLTFELGDSTTGEAWERAGMVLWVHYAYRKGVVTPAINSTMTVTLPLIGVAGSTLDVGALSGSVVGAGQVWNDGSDATYVSYSSGNARSPIPVSPQTVPPSGYTVEIVIRTNFGPSQGGLGVSIHQDGFGGLSAMDSGAAYLDGDGWLHCPQTVAFYTGLADALNGETAPVVIVGMFAPGQVYEGYVVVTWEA